LTIFTKTDGTEVPTDLVVILPDNAPHETPIIDLLYQSYLGLIKHAHARLIKQLSGADERAVPTVSPVSLMS
jgi:hypothetical protein